MKRLILISILGLSIALAGCATISGAGNSPSSAPPRIIRSAQVASKWEVRHIYLDIAPGEQMPVLLKLADGDKVDGYFYLEKGNNVDFQITATTPVFKSTTPSTGGPRGLVSDRFSFTATQAQGASYTLTFRNAASASDKQAGVNIFLEIIYPSTGSIFTPLEK